MQKGHVLQFNCQECGEGVRFSVFELEKNPLCVCNKCGLSYDFNDPVLTRQIQKFEALCRQIRESEEILSNTSIGIYVGDKELKIPYKLLLSRMNSTLDLTIGGRPLTIIFRIEPVQETS